MRNKVTIRAVKHPRYRYRVNYPEMLPDGSRVRRAAYHATRTDADRFAEEKQTELGNFGVKHADIADAERQALIHYRQWAETRPDAPALLDVVREAIARADSQKPRMTVAKAIAERLDLADRTGCSERHRNDTRQRLEKFEKSFGDRQLLSVTTREIETWLHGLKLSPVSFGNYRRALNSVFAYAIKRGAIESNPCAGVIVPKAKKGLPGILTPAQLGALLNAATTEIRAALAIQAFAGLRRAEVERLEWKDVQLKQGHIIIGAGIAKTAGRRVVPVTPALKAWLAPLAKSEGKIAPSPQVYQDRLDAARRFASLERWPANCLRHSAASYWLASEQDLARVALWLGHAPAVLQAHYRALVSLTEAKKWFALRPPPKNTPKRLPSTTSP